MPDEKTLRFLLESIASGQVSPDVGLEKLKNLNYESIEEFAKIDNHRALRTGFPEVIWGHGKTTEQIIKIMNVMRQRTSVVMATRIQPEVYIALKSEVSDLQYYESARICAIFQGKTYPEDPTPYTIEELYPGVIVVISAGTADLPVAEEAAVTAELSGFQVQRLWDVGVAGIHRLLDNRDLIASASVLIVVAGMEGALPSVVAGLANSPVIAVPTSIGYGASFNGLAPLLTMLNSCSAGIGVVNIDNGFGAAILAGQILRTVAKFNQG